MSTSFGGRIREIKQRLTALRYERQALVRELNDLIEKCDHRRLGDHDTCPDCGTPEYYCPGGKFG